MNYLEQVEENKKAIKAEIIEYVALNCIRSSKGVADYYYEVEFRLNNELSISKEVNDRNNYLDFLNKKLEEVFRSNNPLTVKWRVINYPLLTTLEKEYNLFFEFDSILKIKRGTNKKENKGGFMNIPSYYNDEIIDYLEGMKTLMNKDNELKEIDVIEFLCDHYYIYSGVENYESGEYRPNMKDDIKEFLFTYIDYILYSKYKADYINSKQSNDIEEKQIPKPIYDKNNNLYYKLFTPLKKRQEEEVFEIWLKNIEEDIIIRKQEIEEYCKKENCDFIRAIYSVYNKIKDKYLCKSRLEGEENFFNYKYEYFEESDLINYIKVRILRKIQPLGLENKYHAQDIVNILDKNLFYDYKDAYNVGFTDYDYAEVMYITRQQVIDEENDIKFQIINSLDKRLEDHKNNINNTLITQCKIENFDSLPEIEKKMYFKKPSSDEEYLLSLQKKEQNRLTLTTLKSLFNIFSSDGIMNLENINEFITNLTKEYSLVLTNGLIDQTIKQIHDRCTNYVCINKGENIERNELFLQDFDNEFEDALDIYFESGFFDNSNLKLKKLFAKDEFRQLKFVLDRLREIRGEKDFMNKNSTIFIDLPNDNSSKQAEQHIKENTKEGENKFKTIYTNEELKEIFRKSMDKNLFNKDTRLEDFLYVFGGGEKPTDFNKLVWIIKSKSKQVNKKLLILYFMKIYNLKRDEVLSHFIQFINDRVIAGDNPVAIGSKPDLTYKPQELEGLFDK